MSTRVSGTNGQVGSARWARSSASVHHQPEEIVDGWWWTDAELRAHLADPTWPFVPDTRVLTDQLLA